MPDHPSRRELLRQLLGGAAVAAPAALLGSRCSESRPAPSRPTTARPSRPPRIPVIEVKGSHREIGRALGEGARARIHAALAGQPNYAKLVRAARGPLAKQLKGYREVVQKQHPAHLDEIHGLAEGAGLKADDLFAWNCRSELDIAACACAPGCSTVGRVSGGQASLAHHEDGHGASLHRMVLLRALPPSGVGFAALVYPGLLPGNGPGLNSRGLVQATNFIAPRTVGPGLPRYFLGRAVLEAPGLEAAIKLITNANRAFPWHHNLMDLGAGKLVSLETWPGKHHRRDVSGLHLHTNHLLHPEMQDQPEDRRYLAKSSGPRFDALKRLVAKHPPRTPPALLKILQDHSGKPCRLCRHPGDPVSGVTLAAALFSSPTLEMTVLPGPPCQGQAQVIKPL